MKKSKDLTQTLLEALKWNLGPQHHLFSESDRSWT